MNNKIIWNIRNKIRSNIRTASGNWAYLRNPNQWTKQTMQEYRNNINKLADSVINYPLFEDIFKDELTKDSLESDEFEVLQKKVWKILNQLQKTIDIEGDFKNDSN